MESSSRSAIHDILEKGFRLLGLLLIIVLVTWFIKAFLFSIYYIPSGSMKPTLSQGDYVLVSKFPYNLRTPEYYPLTDIPFPNYSADGLGKVRRSDIVVFDLPLLPSDMHPSQKEDYIKRIAGIPGDMTGIYNERYYLVKSENTKNEFTNAQVFTPSLPSEGSWIILTDSTKRFWESILIRDGNNVTYDASGDGVIYGSKRKKYRVKQDYYFMQGDNTNFSSDSRSWGLVPQRNLIGRAELVLWPWPPRWL